MNPFLAGLCAVAAVVIVEVVLSARWNLVYFTRGLPIFIRRIEGVRNLEGVSLEMLERSSATVAAAPLVFRRLGADTIAFRERGLGGLMHYVPLMHGVIRSNLSEPSVVVMGLVNWWFPAILLTLGIALGRHVVDVALYPAAAFAILYFIQGVRYYRVASALRSPQTAVV